MMRQPWRLLLVTATLVAATSCGGGGDNPLLGDPMADVQITEAPRVQRRVQDASGGSWWSKQRPAQVVQVYRAASSGAATTSVITELRTRAVAAGWVFQPSIPGQAEAADKRVEGASALLTLAVLEPGARDVVLLLKQTV